MNNRRPAKNQIQGRLNKQFHDQQPRNLARPRKVANSKVSLPNRIETLEPHINIDLSCMTGVTFLFLIIIFPGIFFNAQCAQFFADKKQLNANGSVIPLQAANVSSHPYHAVTAESGINYPSSQNLISNKKQGNHVHFLKKEIKNSREFQHRDTAFFSKNNIDIIIQSHAPSTLPYQEVELLDPHKNPMLKKFGIFRDMHTRIALRSDSRTIEQIFEAGGFHPQFANPKITPLAGRQPLNLYSHRHGMQGGSGFVSTTVDLCVAHHLGAYLSNYTVYTVLATGAMTPATESGFYGSEKEYSVPGGIDKEDIIAFRDCRSKGENYVCSDLYLNSIFVNKYPHLEAGIVSTQLLPGEVINP